MRPSGSSPYSSNSTKETPSSLRICRIAHYLPPMVGGYQFHVQSLTRWLANRGHETLLYALDGEIEEGPNVVVRKLGFSAITFQPRKYLICSGYLNLGVLARRREISRFRPHLLHAHGDHLEGFCLALLKKALGVPTIITIHGARSDRALHRWLGRKAFRLVDRVIVVSKALQQELLSLGVPERKINVISSGIDAASFRRSPLEGLTNKSGRIKVQILSVGRLHPVKGYDVLIEALCELRQMAGDIVTRIVGDGPEEKRLRQLAEGRNIYLDFVGRLSPPDIRDLLARADLFVMPSVNLGRQAEGTPTAILEAMAAGLPIVASDSGGIRHLVENGVNGVLVPERDPKALAQAIISLIENPGRTHAMADANIVKAKKSDWSVVGERVEQLYREVLRKNEISRRAPKT